MIRHAEAEWNGGLKGGKGHLKVETGTIDAPYSFKSRFGDGNETNPEELLGAAHAACFSMALSAMLEGAGHPPTSVKTKASVHLNQVTGGWAIETIDLETVGIVPGIDAAKFEEVAGNAKAGCPVSKALAGAKITLKATLVEG
jgi:osmotically inducible protein OsmC